MKDSLVVYGPPGTGKSTFLVRQIREYLDSGLDPKKIGVVSFTRAAARELTKRTGSMWDTKNVGTLHSFAFRLIECSREQVVDRAKLAEFSRLVKVEVTGSDAYDDTRKGVGDQYLFTYGLHRATLAESWIDTFMQHKSAGTFHEFMYFVEAYREWKRENGYVDFEDMIQLAYEADNPELDVLIIDEAQDLSPSQWRLINKWTATIPMMILALDDDQTLFRFNGADPTGGPRFEQEHGSRRTILDKSYRVPSVIHALADRLIHRISDRVEKDYIPARDGGEVRQYGSWSMLPTPEPTDDVLILYRNHDLRKQAEEWLQDHAVPYTTENGRPGPLQGRTAKAIRAWSDAQSSYRATGSVILSDHQWRTLQFAAWPAVATAIRNRDVERFIGNGWDKVVRMSLHEARFFQRMQVKYGTPIPGTKIRLSTIHGAKGWEADRVILFDSMSGATVQGYAQDPDSEVRCFYVGVTRTRDILDIVIGEDSFGVMG